MCPPDFPRLDKLPAKPCPTFAATGCPMRAGVCTNSCYAAKHVDDYVAHKAETQSANPKDAFGLAKPPLRLIPAASLMFMARVFGLGAKKYGPLNWRKAGVRHTVYLEAALRHILQALDGEKVDPESGQPHEAHAMACMAIVLDAKSVGKLIDDLPTPGNVAAVIAELTEKMPKSE